MLEHLERPDNLVEEIYRISKDGARLIIEVPHFSSHIAYSDLTHKRYFSFVLLERLINSIPHKALKEEITFYKTFRLFGIKFLANKFKEDYERFWTYIFPAENIRFEVEVKK
jgi:SAM-dependent methyltransferase